MKYILILLISVVFMTSGCRKSEEFVPCTFDSTNFSGQYMITEATIKDDAQSLPIDDYATWSECEKDDLYSIESNGTITFSEGAVSCDPPSAMVSYQWKLNCNQFYLVGYSTIYTVSDLSSTGFYLTNTDPNDGKIYSYRYTRQ